MSRIDKKSTNFFRSNPSNSSERVRIILSNPSDAKKFAHSIRMMKKGKKEEFTVSKETRKALKATSK